MHPENIFIIGTSSAGKTSLSHQFPSSYKKIRIDDYYDKYFDECYKKVLTNIKNTYYSPYELRRKTWKMFDNIMAQDIKKMGKTVIDDVNITLVKVVPAKNRLAILLYAPLRDMIRNIHSRRASETRDLTAFDQFPTLYTATCDPKRAIDIVNRRQFMKDLEAIKWLFESRADLENFAINLFQKLGIVTDENYMIRVKDPIFDHVVNTRDKTSADIYKEIKTLF